jgi:DNA-binding transcriptional regulator of glucitol operon
VSPKWLGWHVFVILATAGMLALGNWQLHRAEAGNPLSWAYTFEWPIFAVFAVVFWVKTIRDELHPPAAADAAAVELPPGAGRPAGGADPAAPPSAEDDELAAYNAYLARLHNEVRGHGKWHGLR